MINIIPAIDIIDGQCVRLSQGDYATKKVYNQDPLEIARQFEAAGINRLHLVDLDGARAGRIVNHKVLDSIAQHTDLQIDFGGGIRREADLRAAFDCGAHQITVGSLAVTEKERVLEWLASYGSDKIILGADVRNRKIAIHGWQAESRLDLIQFLQEYHRSGIRASICTDISRDGRMQGAALGLYREIKSKLPTLFLIASGGVAHIDDIEKLQQSGIDGVIIGKALYEGRIQLTDLKAYLC